MKGKKITLTFLIATIILGVTLIRGVNASPSSALIYVDPQTSIATYLGEVFTINVNIANVANLSVAKFKMGYNTTLLNVTSVVEGDFLKKFGGTFFYKEIHEDLGYVKVETTYIWGGPADGNGTLATISFKATYYGSVSCTLDLYDTILRDPNLNDIPHVITDGNYYARVLTVATDKLLYAYNESVKINGNFSLGESPIDGLVALEVVDPSDKPIVYRTLKTGTNPPVGNVDIVNIYSCDEFGYPKTSFLIGFDRFVYFNVTVRNNGPLTESVKVTINAYDGKNAPFGAPLRGITLEPGQTWYLFPGVPIPNWISNGSAAGYASVFTGDPSQGGIAYNPEKSAAFEITGVGGGGAGGAAAVGFQKTNNGSIVLTDTLGSYNLTFKIPGEATQGVYTVYVSSSYQERHVEDSSVFGLSTMIVPYNYSTIQEAVDAADPQNNIIFVFSGTYYEHVTINKSLTLVGENPSNTIIDGNGTGTVVYVASDNVTIRRFTIQNSGSSSPSGIYLNYSSRNTISENIISNNYNGIYLNYSSRNTIKSNTITLNNGYGIYLNRCTGNTLKDNNMAGNGYNFGVAGDSLSDFTHDIDTSNKIGAKPIYYLMNEKDKEISDAGYIAVVNSTNIVIKGLTLTENGQGVLFAFTNFSLIERVDTTNNEYGIYLDNSYNNTIIGGTVSDNAVGIYLRYCNGNIICHQNFINNINQIARYQSSNIWDDGAGKGNRWSDYNGTDDGSGGRVKGDGVGDTNLPWQGVDYYPLMSPWIPAPDIAVTRVTPILYIVNDPAGNIYPGWKINVNVTVRNKGDFTQTFSARARFYNATYTEAGPLQTIDKLAPLKERNITVICTTNGASPFLNYTIKVETSTIPGETNTTDNTLIDGQVKVRFPGDASGDRFVDVDDLQILGWHWQKTVPPGDPKADFSGDSFIDVDDLQILGWNWQKPK